MTEAEAKQFVEEERRAMFLLDYWVENGSQPDLFSLLRCMIIGIYYSLSLRAKYNELVKYYE